MVVSQGEPMIISPRIKFYFDSGYCSTQRTTLKYQLAIDSPQQFNFMNRGTKAKENNDF